MRRLVALTMLVAACGDDKTPAQPDASVAADAMPDALVFPACREFGAAPINVPALVTSSLAGADVQSPMQCAIIDAPYGIASAGPDSVVPLQGLVPGTAYNVRLLSAADLAFYVVGGCSTMTGPAASECMLFVDASAGAEEVGRFVATAPTAFVVVDYYASATPASQAFTLDVYPEECTGDATCAPTPGVPVCYHGRCVACVDSFDCTSAAMPRCDRATNTCTTGVDNCITDDATEPMDDGPAGAVVLVPDGGGAISADAQICSSPRSEADYYSFDVVTRGETWDISLSWSGARDLDLEVRSATGEAIGLSFWEQPETMRLSYLPIGTYYVQVTDFSPTTTTSVSYTLAGQRVSTTGCTTRADCAADYRNQVFRGNCDNGACVSIIAKSQTAGAACDSEDDCAGNLACPDFFFVADADTRSVCAPHCANDIDCAVALGSNYVCTTFLATANFCVRSCTTDEQCPTDPSSQPLVDPWYRLTCQTSTGRCVFQ